MDEIVVHPHALKHGLDCDDIAHAWVNFVRRRPRGDDCWVTIGFDSQGREIEMVGMVCANGSVLVIHALSPATEKLKRELGLTRR